MEMKENIYPKLPTAPPIEDQGEGYRLQKINEIQTFLEKEVANREALSKKYFIAARIVDNEDTVLIEITLGGGAGGISLLFTVIAAPAVIAIEGVALFTGLLSIIGKYSVKRSTSKAEKHEKIKMIAFTKLDTTSSHISKALSDNKVVDEEFKLILEELEKYKAMKEEVRTKTKKKIATETEESLIERGRQEAHESFRRLVKKKQYWDLSIPVVFPALLLTMKITIKIVSKTAMKIMLKNYDCNKKKMSFLKISDPVKRDLIVKEYLELKKNIRDNLLSERIGEQQLQTDLSKFYRPITETQKATAREITEGL